MEINLYDRHGIAVAYISDDGENSIYLWDGHAVAYLDSEAVYGWSGHHLGWFIDGIIYDARGQRVGFTSSKCPVAAHAAPASPAKQAKSAKYAKHALRARSALSTGVSDKPLGKFLRET
jgi:hypothetical protein